MHVSSSHIYLFRCTQGLAPPKRAHHLAFARALSALHNGGAARGCGVCGASSSLRPRAGARLSCGRYVDERTIAAEDVRWRLVVEPVGAACGRPWAFGAAARRRAGGMFGRPARIPKRILAEPLWGGIGHSVLPPLGAPANAPARSAGARSTSASVSGRACQAWLAKKSRRCTIRGCCVVRLGLGNGGRLGRAAHGQRSRVSRHECRALGRAWRTPKATPPGGERAPRVCAARQNLGHGIGIPTRESTRCGQSRVALLACRRRCRNSRRGRP